MNYKIYRGTRSKSETLFRIIAWLLFAFTLVGMVVVVRLLKEAELSQPIELVMLGLVIVTLFAGFGTYAKASGIHNYVSLNVFAMDGTGKLYRVFYTAEDVGTDTRIPVTTVGKAASIANSVKTISNIQEKNDFLKSESLENYLEGVFAGTMEENWSVRIHLIEYPSIISSKHGEIEFFYTVGKHRQIQCANLYDSYEGYETIAAWLQTHAGNSADYTGKKVGECILND